MWLQIQLHIDVKCNWCNHEYAERQKCRWGWRLHWTPSSFSTQYPCSSDKFVQFDATSFLCSETIPVRLHGSDIGQSRQFGRRQQLPWLNNFAHYLRSLWARPEGDIFRTLINIPTSTRIQEKQFHCPCFALLTRDCKFLCQQRKSSLL